jgi:hypothetical protein
MDARAYGAWGSLFIYMSDAGERWEFAVSEGAGCALLLNRRPVAVGGASRASVERVLNLFLAERQRDQERARPRPSARFDPLACEGRQRRFRGSPSGWSSA